jgi:hypothetical protein
MATTVPYAGMQPLSPTTTEMERSVRIQCCRCGRSAYYGAAEHTGWKFAPNGVPFDAYYCPACVENY